MLTKLKGKILIRSMAGLLCLLLIAGAMLSMLRDEFNYRNYWGGVVFAPLAILIGFILLFAVLLRWNVLQQPPMDKGGHEIKFPADDFEKW